MRPASRCEGRGRGHTRAHLKRHRGEPRSITATGPPLRAGSAPSGASRAPAARATASVAAGRAAGPGAPASIAPQCPPTVRLGHAQTAGASPRVANSRRSPAFSAGLLASQLKMTPYQADTHQATGDGDEPDAAGAHPLGDSWGMFSL